MATQWGDVVRTGDAGGSSWSGTIAAYLIPEGYTPWWGLSECPTGFKGVRVGCCGASAGLSCVGCFRAPSYPGGVFTIVPGGGTGSVPGDAYYDTLAAACDGYIPVPTPPYAFGEVYVLLWQATVAAWFGLVGGQTAYRLYASAFGFLYPPPGQGDVVRTWISPIPSITSGYSLSTGGIIKRQHGISLPEMMGGGAARQMMHPTDCHVRDAWYLTPGSVATVSAFGLSASATRRDAYPGQTDVEIGDAIMGYGVPNIGVSMSQLGLGYTTGPFATVTGPGFTGMDNSFEDGAGFEVPFLRARGTGGSVSGWNITGAANVWNVASWQGEESPGLQYSFDAQVCVWDQTDPVDPLVNAGMVDEDGHPIITTLSTLPTGPSPGAWVGSGHAYGLTVPYRIHPSQTMSVEIDPFWAMNHWCDAGGTQVFADKALPVNDRYLCTRPPGVNSAVWNALAGIGRRVADVVPLVARQELPDTRWTATSGIVVGDPQEQWTIAAGVTGDVTAALQTRYWERLALIPQPGKAIDWDWPRKLFACAAGEHVDTADEPTYAEDVYSWKDHGWLEIAFDKPADLALSFVLRLGYATVQVFDPHYTCGAHRIAEWSYTRTDAAVDYHVSIPAGRQSVVVDLFCPDDGTLPDLQVVTSVSLIGLRNPGASETVVRLTRLRPCGDQGWDHTGRGTPDRPLAAVDTSLVKSSELWDFMGDYEGVLVRRDGLVWPTVLPDEPNQGGVPERGFGTIQKAQHCPDQTGDLGDINYARALAHLGQLGWSQGFTFSLDQDAIDAMTKSFWKGANNPEVLCPAWLFWTANRTVAADDGGLSVLGAIHTRDYLLALGHPTTLQLRKALGGSALSLLRTTGGRRRLTRLTHGVARLRYAMWRRVTSYVLIDPGTGEQTLLPSSPGAPLPEPGVWQPWREGAVSDRLDAHGLFEWPGMTPAHTRVNNPTQSQTDPSLQTTWATVEYLLQWWWSEAWRLFDINNPASEALAKQHADYAGEAPLSPASRRLASVPAQLPWKLRRLGQPEDPECCRATAPGMGAPWFSPSRGGLVGGPAARGTGPARSLEVVCANGVGRHVPPPDLEVRDSRHALPFARTWRSDRAVSDYGSPGLARGWVHNWDIRVWTDDEPAPWPALVLEFPNGRLHRWTVELSGGVPTGNLLPPPGSSYVVYGTPSATPGQWSDLTMAWSCDTLWSFRPHATQCYALHRRSDPAGLYVEFAWDTERRLTAVANEAAVTLLTLSYDAGGYLSALTDSAGRQVDYTFAALGDEPQTALAQVSPVHLSGETPGAARWSYAYQEVPEVPPETGTVLLLSTVTVPGPEPGQQSTAQLLYHLDGYRAAGVVDGRGVAWRYEYDTDQEVVVELDDAAGTTVGTWSLHFNGDGELLGSTFPGSATYTYADPNNPLKYTTVTDSAGVSQHYSYDAHGRLTTHTDALGNVTTNTFATCAQGLGGLLTSVRGALTIVSNTYDAGDFLWMTQDALGALTTFGYDARGNRARVTDANGYTTTTTYDGHDRQVSRTDPLGATWTYGYDAYGDLAGETDPLGRTTQHIWDLAGNQVAQVNPLGYAATSTYGPSGHRLTAIDALGHTSTWHYDPEGHPLVDITPLGYRTTHSYNAYGGQATVLTPNNQRTAFLTDAYGRALATVDPNGFRTTTTYDECGRPAATQDAQGHLTRTVYDAYNRATGTIDALGHTTATVLDSLSRPIATVSPLGYRTTTSYDALDRPVGGVNAVGDTSWTIYDAVGRRVASIDSRGYRTTTVYDPAGRAIATIDALGWRTSTSYDAAGQAIARQDALGRVTTQVYDEAGHAIASVRPNGARSTTVYDAVGRVSTTIDALGHASSQDYDADGRPVAAVDPLGYRTTSVYLVAQDITAMVDAMSARTTTTVLSAGRAQQFTDALGQVTQTTYDSLYQPVSTRDALDGVTASLFDALGRSVALQDANDHTSHTAYDADGRRLSETTPRGAESATVYDGLGRVIATTDPDGLRTTTRYLSDGRVASVDGDGHLTTWYYDPLGRRLATEDPQGHRTTETYDALGRTVAVQNAGGHTFRTEYDALGAWTASIGPDGRRTTTVYNLAGQQVGTQDPQGRWTLFTYDQRGQTSTRTDGRGWTTTYAYDPVGREIGRLYHDGTRVTTTYDTAGRQTAVEDSLGLTEYVLDALGRQTAVADPRGFRLTYTYDPVGNRRTMLDHDGGLTAYTYNLDDQLATVTNPFAETTTWDWKLSGRLERQTLANGVTAHHTYDNVGRPAALVHRRSDHTVLSSYGATYDAVGNRVRVDELDGTYHYAYDATGQLIDEQRTGTYAYRYRYTYDAMGNRLSMDRGGGLVTSYTYNTGDELLTTESFAAAAALGALRPVVRAPFSGDALALATTLDTGQYAVEQATVVLVGGAGTWDAANHWLVSLQTRNAAGNVVGTLATATFAQAGAGLVRLPVPVPSQAVDASATPQVTVAVSQVGQPGPLLSAAGTATLFRDEDGAMVPWGDGGLGGLVAAPYSSDALALVMPLSTAHTYLLSSVTLDAVGAAGTWDESDHWAVTLLLCTAGLVGVTTIAAGTITAAGGSRVDLTLPEPLTIDVDATPVLAVAITKVGQPPRLLRTDAAVTFAGTQSLGVTNITYDQNGNTLAEAAPGHTVTYTWDAEDRLVQVAENGRVEDYAYGADGLRRRKATPDGTTECVWDQQNLLAEVSSGATAAQYTDFPGYWGGLSTVRKGAVSSHLTYDMSANTRQVTDAGGAVVSAPVYTAFGTELAASAGVVGFGGQVGYYRDQAARLYVRARHYQVRSGSWLSNDLLSPMEPPYNLRFYASNRPVRDQDATGMGVDHASKQELRKRVEWVRSEWRKAGGKDAYPAPKGGKGVAEEPELKGIKRLCRDHESLKIALFNLYRSGIDLLRRSDYPVGAAFLEYWYRGYGGDLVLNDSIAGLFWKDYREQRVCRAERECLSDWARFSGCGRCNPPPELVASDQSGGHYRCPNSTSAPAKSNVDLFLATGTHRLRTLLLGRSCRPVDPNCNSMQCSVVHVFEDDYNFDNSYAAILRPPSLGVEIMNAWAACIQENGSLGQTPAPRHWTWSFQRDVWQTGQCHEDSRRRDCCDELAETTIY